MIPSTPIDEVTPSPLDAEEIFGTIFGGEKFIPIFGHISLAKDMKTALQEEEEGEEPGKPGQKKTLSPEEKAKKLQKEQAVLAQVRPLCLITAA